MPVSRGSSRSTSTGLQKEKRKKMGATLDGQMPMIAGPSAYRRSIPNAPDADLLYGHDIINAETRDEQRPRRRVFLEIEPFDPSRHVTEKEQSGGNQKKDREFRKRQKKGRR